MARHRGHRRHHTRSHRRGKGGGGGAVILPFVLGIALTTSAVKRVNTETNGEWDNTAIGLLCAGIIFLICAAGITVFLLYIIGKACIECFHKCLKDPVVQYLCGPGIRWIEKKGTYVNDELRSLCPSYWNRMFPPSLPPVTSTETSAPIPVVSSVSPPSSSTSHISSSSAGTGIVTDALSTSPSSTSVTIVTNVLNTVTTDSLNGVPKNGYDKGIVSLSLPSTTATPPTTVENITIDIPPPPDSSATKSSTTGTITTGTVPTPSAPSIRNLNELIANTSNPDNHATNTSSSSSSSIVRPSSIDNTSPISSSVIVTVLPAEPSAPTLLHLSSLETTQIEEIVTVQTNVQSSLLRLQALTSLIPSLSPDTMDQTIYKELFATMEAPLESTLQSIVIDIQTYLSKLRSIPYECIRKGLENKQILSINQLRNELITIAKKVHDHYLSVWDNDSANYYRTCLNLLSEYENEYIMYTS